MEQADSDLLFISNLLDRIDNYAESDSITEEELAAMEQTLERLKFRYGLEAEMQR